MTQIPTPPDFSDFASEKHGKTILWKNGLVLKDMPYFHESEMINSEDFGELNNVASCQKYSIYELVSIEESGSVKPFEDMRKNM